MIWQLLSKVVNKTILISEINYKIKEDIHKDLKKIRFLINNGRQNNNKINRNSSNSINKNNRNTQVHL